MQIVSECQKYPANKIDLDKVKKTVLKSQPPRAEDVPFMADYVKRWGGLPQGKFIKELAMLLRQSMPAGRIVNGSFFQQASAMKFPVAQQPADFINALLFAHAAADNHVRDNMSQYITKGDLNAVV